MNVCSAKNSSISKENSSRSGVKNSLCIFTIRRKKESTRNCQWRDIESLSTQSRRTFRRFVLLTHSFAHLRHSSLPAIQILIQLRRTTRLHLFLRPRFYFFFSRDSLRPTHTILAESPQRNLNLIMTLHVAILTPTPPSVAYLPLASSDIKSCGLSPFCSPRPLPIGTRSREVF